MIRVNFVHYGGFVPRYSAKNQVRWLVSADDLSFD